MNNNFSEFPCSAQFLFDSLSDPPLGISIEAQRNRGCVTCQHAAFFKLLFQVLSDVIGAVTSRGTQKLRNSQEARLAAKLARQLEAAKAAAAAAEARAADALAARQESKQQVYEARWGLKTIHIQSSALEHLCTGAVPPVQHPTNAAAGSNQQQLQVPDWLTLH